MKSNTADYWSRLHNGLNCLELDLYSLYLSDNTEVPSEKKDGTEFEIQKTWIRISGMMQRGWSARSVLSPGVRSQLNRKG